MPREIQVSDATVHRLIGDICDQNDKDVAFLNDLANQPITQTSGVTWNNVKQPVERVCTALANIRDLLDGKITIG